MNSNKQKIINYTNLRFALETTTFLTFNFTLKRGCTCFNLESAEVLVLCNALLGSSRREIILLPLGVETINTFFFITMNIIRNNSLNTFCISSCINKASLGGKDE